MQLHPLTEILLTIAPGTYVPTPEARLADDVDGVADQAGALARTLGIDVGDSPLVRRLRDPEARVGGGRARSYDEAIAWLRAIPRPPGASDELVASFVERLAPALLPLRAMNAHFFAAQRARPKDLVKAQRRLVDDLERRVGDARYATIQERYLNYRALVMLLAIPKGWNQFVLEEKYLNLPLWVCSKLDAARKLELDKKKPMAVLDLGAGPGHFGVVCQHLGHDFLGLDMEYPWRHPFSYGDLYGDLFALFGLERSIQQILPFTPLRVPRRFDLVSCMMGTFSLHLTDAGPVPWQWPEWAYFLRDLVTNVLNPKFEIYLHVNREFFAPEVMEQMRALGAAVDAERFVARFTERQTKAILEGR